MNLRRLLCFLVAGMGATQVATMAGPQPEETAFAAVPVPAENSQPITLSIGVNDIYCSKTACDCISEIATRSYDGVLAALKQHHITLQITYFMEVMDLEKAIKAKDFDGVICKPWTAVRLSLIHISEPTRPY